MNPLQEAVQNRNIDNLVHFTRLENLINIMAQGLVPRTTLEANKTNVNFNDQERIDGCKNATCLSICFPNYKMFWACRKENPDVKWVVLTINPKVLWEKDCAFCHENAASNAVTEISLNERKSISAFNRLYSEFEDKPSRRELQIPERAPTNPQAEVLVFDIIEPKLISAICVENDDLLKEVKKSINTVDIQKIPEFFRARKDYKHWQH